MALDPMIARGVQPVDISNTLAQVAALRQRDQGLQQSAQQNSLMRERFDYGRQQDALTQQQEEEQDRLWNEALDAGDIERAMRIDPEETRFFLDGQKMLKPAAPVTEQSLPSGRVLAMQDGKPIGQPWAAPDPHGGMGQQEPFDVQTYKYYLNQSPETQARILEYRRGNSTPEIAANIASAKTTATEQAKVLVGAQTDLPRVAANADQMLANLDQFEKHPGTRFLYGGYGIAPIVPGTPQADAAAVLEQIGGKAFLEAFNSLKGGGQITEKEGEKATAAITRLGNRKQSYAGAKQAVAELRAIVKAGASRARQKAGTDQPRRRRYNPETGTIE
jgi:hypothetical protein